MTVLTLGQAAKLAKVGKTTLTRAIKAGRLSATRRDDGGYNIDVSELSRVYSITVETPDTVAATGHAVRHATPDARPRDPEESREVTARLAALEAEVQGLKDLLSEVRQSRDDWKDQAARLALSPPIQPESTAPAIPVKRSWWSRLTG